MRHDFHDETEEPRSQGAAPPRATARRLLQLLRPHAGQFALGVGLLLASIAADLAGPLVLRALIDRVVPTGRAGAILGAAAVFLGLFLAGRAAQLAQVSVLTRTGLAAVTALKKRVFEHLLSLSLDYFDRNPPGRLLARVESDSERLLALFSEVGAALVGTALVFAASAGLMLATDARVALWTLAVLAPIAVANIFYVRYLARFYVAERKAYAALSGFLGEYIPAVPTIQAFGIERAAAERLEERNRARLRAEAGAAFREYPFWGFVQAGEVAIVAAILWFGAGAGALTVGTLVLFIEYARRLFLPIAQFSEQLNLIQRAFAAAERVFEVLDTPSRTPDRPGARPEVPADWRELRFENVAFAYQGGGRRALEGVSFRVRRGEKVAIVGISGSGKTTLANLLLRYYDPTAGRIALDGEDIRAFRKAPWRRRIGLILQEIHLFPGTVAENLAVFHDPPPPPEAIARALEIAEARDVVARLPRGLDTDLAEGGANLSLGERQLLSFARALARDPEILVLDEATSSVDPATERRLQRTLARALEGRTAIVIAHRLATVRMADRILVFHDGRIVEEGPHAELYARGGIYRRLCDLQLAEPRTA